MTTHKPVMSLRGIAYAIPAGLALWAVILTVAWCIAGWLG
jgi:hypothetical protein